MLLLDEHNAADWLRASGRVPAAATIRVDVLAGGVSNQVLYVTVAGERPEEFVLKQAREQLRTPDAWFSRLDRIWREVDVLRTCQQLLAADRDEPPLAARTPEIRFEDRDEYAFAMSAAPKSAQVWKAQLLAGQIEPRIARECGRLLGLLHAGSWHNTEVARQLADRQIFDELRIDPYYRRVRELHPKLNEPLSRLIDSLESEHHALVHADFSPENLLVHETGMLMVDFETGHYGDPAFDLGFFLSHLLLKAIYHAPARSGEMLTLTTSFWEGYQPRLRSRVDDTTYSALVQRGIANLGGCLLARVDGKSQVDYLPQAERREAVRRLAVFWLRSEVTNWAGVLQLAGEECGKCR